MLALSEQHGAAFFDPEYLFYVLSRLSSEAFTLKIIR
eukprot:COSAG05_NODE_407_length_10145_cov_234.042604_12_plen_37_part_00